MKEGIIQAKQQVTITSKWCWNES